MGFCIISLSGLFKETKQRWCAESKRNWRNVSDTWLQDERCFTGGPASDSYIKDCISGLLSSSCFTTNKSSW